jgi:multiple sugar transport system ATP-binding protein
MAAIRLEGLTRRYGEGAAALDGLDLAIADGELVCVVGPSGCGKSTMLRLIAGLDLPDGGRISLGDRDVSRVPPQDRDVAMVFQGYALYPHLSVFENIAFPLKMRGVPRSARAEQVRDVAALLGLSALLERRPGELSGGERQRVAMGRAIVRHPKAFLFDEPLSNLDAALRSELRVELGALLRRLGTTSIYVTHDQVEAMTLGDRIVVLKSGVLQQVGPPRTIYEDPHNSFVASFLGSPRINLIELENLEGRLRAPGIDWPTPHGGGFRRRAMAGIRAEHLRIGEPTADEAVIQGLVLATEPLGAETNLHIEVQGARVVVRAPGFETLAPGDRASVCVRLDRVLYFDAGSGERIRNAAVL